MRCATSWRELDALAAVPGTTSMVLDPALGGSAGLDAAIRVIRRHSNVAAFAYVLPTPRNLKAVLLLGQHGLATAFCCGEFNASPSLKVAIESAAYNSLPCSFLNLVEARMGQLPQKVAVAVSDAFERPRVYDNVSDLARKAGIRNRTLSRLLANAGLGTPKKLLTIAKVLRGVAYMQSTSMSVASVSCKLSYADPRVFNEVIASIFGSSPTALRKQGSAEEILLHVCEWLYKPRVSHW